MPLHHQFFSILAINSNKTDENFNQKSVSTFPDKFSKMSQKLVTL